MLTTNLLTSSTLVTLLLALASNVVRASASPSPLEIPNILLPSPNITGGPIAEIQCYALPYGAVGIISHLLTYWTIAWMAVGRVPLWPWHKMKTWRFDLFLAIAALCTCIPIASITIHRCRLSWHFILISIWKLVTSVSLACISIHRCILVRRIREAREHGTHHQLRELDQDTRYEPQRQMYQQYNNSSWWQDEQIASQGREDHAPLWWLLLYLAGTVVGMVGLFALLWTTFRHNKTVRRLTYGFATPMILAPLLVGIYWFQHHLERPEGGRKVLVSAYIHTFGSAVLAFIAVFGFFSALYSDLVLGAVAENLIGFPTTDYAPLYWIWFIAKRLPMLSF